MILDEEKLLNWCRVCSDRFKNKLDLRSIYIYGMCTYCFKNLKIVKDRCKFCFSIALYGSTCRKCAEEVIIKIQNYD